MKKLITGILATLACVACLTGCELLEPVSPDTSAPTNNSVPTDGAIDLEGAKVCADDMFRTSNTSVRADYELPNFLNYDNQSYPLSWSVNVTEGVVVEVKDDKTIINVDETLLTELEYTLTLTIADPTDATKTVTVAFNRIVEAAPSKVPAKITEAPKEETPYKLHIYHAQLQSDYYMTGDIYKSYEYYFDITTDYDKAIDIYVEAVEGEEGMFYMFHNGTENLTGKHYINARKTSDNKHISNYFETTPETKWFFDEELGTMVTTINDLEGNDTKFFLGCDTDTSHKSVSPQSDANANKGYLIEMVDRTTVSNADKIAQTKKELAVSPVFVGAGEMKLPTQGTTFPDATIAWTATGATYADGTLTFAAPTAATTVTLTATISCGDATPDTKELTVNLVPNTPETILDATATLKSGETYANEVTLTGIVSEFMKISNSEDGTYNEQYGNISVKLMVAYNDTYKTIGCYHISGVGTADVQPGYTIKVTGFITNHNGSAQFAQDSKLEIVKTGTEADIPTVNDTLDTPEKILNAAYALAEGTALEGTHSLTGKITSIDEQYSTQYQNITVTITVDGFTDKPMKCYRMKGTGAESLKVGDTITVTGTIKNYSGTIEFDTGCTFVLSQGGDTVTPPAGDDNTPSAATPIPDVDADATSYTLDPAHLGFTKDEVALTSYANSLLTFAHTKVNDSGSKFVAYEGIYALRLYKNDKIAISIKDGYTIKSVTVSLNDMTDGKYLIKDDTYVGNATATGYDTASVVLTPVDGTKPVEIIAAAQIRIFTIAVEFEKANDNPGEGDNTENPAPTYTTPQEIMDAAYALENSNALTGTYTLTGVITNVDTAYDSGYKNVTVTMKVNEVTGDNTTIQCFRLSGTGADLIDVGYTITVTGSISKYSNGKVQFTSATLDSSIAPELTNADKVEQAIAELSIPVVYVGETTYNLPTSGKHESTIAWTGDNVTANVLNANASAAAEVILKATVTVGTASDDVSIAVKLIPNNAADIATAAAALTKGQTFANAVSLTGTVTEIVKAYDSTYGNITVNMKIADTETIIQCYRLTGGETLAVDTVITVTGIIKNFNDTLEFDAKCTYVEVNSGNEGEGGGEVTPPPADDDDDLVSGEIVLDFAANFATFGASWNNSYTSRTISFKEVGIDGDGKVILSNANKQSDTITDRPVICAKNVAQYVTIDLGTSDKNIQSVTFDLQQWSDKTFADIHIEYSVDGTEWDTCSDTITTPGTLSSNVTIPAGATVRLSFVASKSKNTQIGLSKITLTVD